MKLKKSPKTKTLGRLAAYDATGGVFMVQTQVLKEPVLDKIELLVPPRVTLQIAAIAAERGQSINEAILDAINEYIKKSKQ